MRKTHALLYQVYQQIDFMLISNGSLEDVLLNESEFAILIAKYVL